MITKLGLFTLLQSDMDWFRSLRGRISLGLESSVERLVERKTRSKRKIYALTAPLFVECLLADEGSELRNTIDALEKYLKVTIFPVLENLNTLRETFIGLDASLAKYIQVLQN